MVVHGRAERTSEKTTTAIIGRIIIGRFAVDFVPSNMNVSDDKGGFKKRSDKPPDRRRIVSGDCDLKHRGFYTGHNEMQRYRSPVTTINVQCVKYGCVRIVGKVHERRSQRRSSLLVSIAITARQISFASRSTIREKRVIQDRPKSPLSRRYHMLDSGQECGLRVTDSSNACCLQRPVVQGHVE